MEEEYMVGIEPRPFGISSLMSVTVPTELSLLHFACIAECKRNIILNFFESGEVHLVQALRLCTGRTAHRGSRGIALLYRH
jgi:hypothetical protein